MKIKVIKANPKKKKWKPKHGFNVMKNRIKKIKWIK